MGCKKFKLRQHEIFSKKSNHLGNASIFQKKNGIGLFLKIRKSSNPQIIKLHFTVPP